MPEAVSVTVAKFVTSQITAATLSQADRTIDRSYADWDLEFKNTDSMALSEADKLRIDIASHTTEQAAELSTRGTLKFTAPIDIAVRRKFGSDTLDSATGRIPVAEIDALVLLTQELHVLLTKLRTSDALAAVWETTQLLSNPITEHLRELRQFTSIIRIGFRADVDLT